jgi:hypothetical protein
VWSCEDYTRHAEGTEVDGKSEEGVESELWEWEVVVVRQWLEESCFGWLGKLGEWDGQIGRIIGWWRYVDGGIIGLVIIASFTWLAPSHSSQDVLCECEIDVLSAA